MREFVFDLQRFSFSLEFSYGTKTFTDPGVLNVYPGQYEVWHYNEKTYWGGADMYGIRHDKLENSDANYVQMYARDKGSSINNWGGSHALIVGGAGDDTIKSWEGDYVEISGGMGNDQISYYGYNSTVRAGAGNDLVLLGCENNEVYTGSDNWQDEDDDKVILGYGNSRNDTIYTGYGNDTVSIGDGSRNDTIDTGSGNDSIFIERGAESISVYGGYGDDTIENYGEYVTIDAGDGNNTIKNGSFELQPEKVLSQVHSSAVPIYKEFSVISESMNGGDDVTITAGKNDDKIQNVGGDNVTIDAGDGDNQVSLIGRGENISVTTGTGNDTIVAYSFEDPLYYNQEQKRIYSYGNHVTIDVGGGNNFVSVGSDWLLVTIEGGNDREGIDAIFNEARHACIEGNGGYNIIRNSGNYSHIYGGDDGNQLLNYGDHVLLKGGNSIDYIYSNDAEDVEIRGGGEADTIEVYHDVDAVIDGGEGNDHIFVGRVSAEDFVALTTDMIVDMTNAILSLFSNKVPATISTKSRDWLLALASFALQKVKFVGMGLTAVSGILTILDKLSPDSLLSKLNYSESTVIGGKGDDTVVLDGFAPRVVEYSEGDGKDVIYYMATNRAAYEANGKTTAANHLSTLYIKSGKIDTVTAEGNDIILKIGEGSVKLKNAANYEFKLREADGTLTTRIYSTNGDDHPLYGGDNFVICGNGGNDHIFSARFPAGDTVSNVTINGGAGDDTINAIAKNVIIEYNEGDGNDIVHNFGVDDTLKISALSYTLERKGFDLIVHVGNGPINLKGCRLLSALGGVNIDGTPENNLVEVEFYDMQLDGEKLSLLKLNPNEVLDVNELDTEIKIIDASQAQTSIKVIGNSAVNKFTGSKYSDDIRVSPQALDNAADLASSADIIADSDTSAGISTVTVDASGGDNPILYAYKSGDGNDVIYNLGASDMLSISGGNYSSTKSGSDIIFTVGSGSITVKNAKAKTLSLIDKSGKSYTTVVGGTSTTSTLMTVTNTTKSPVTLGAAIKTVNASSRTSAVKITGNSSANSILGGKAADTLWGGAGNDTLTGGNGNDIFVYSAGKDVITDYAVGDRISLGAAVSKATVNSSDVVFTVGSGSLTIKNAKAKTLSLIDKSGKSYTTVVGGTSTTSTLMTVTNTTKSPVTLGAAIKTVNASSRTSAVKITGNSSANSILGGKAADTLIGDAGNDTLRGGAGNDSLWGGAGNDILYGDAGKDTFIYKPGEGKDTITGFETGDLLQITGTFSGTYNSSKKEIYFKVGSTANALTLKNFTATSFNINGANYGISGSKLVKK